VSKSYVVYWLHDQNCTNPMEHGYIGVTSRQRRRAIMHRYNRRFPKFEMTILFRGERIECLNAEAVFRPRPNIGWNKATGGGHESGHLRGIPKSPEQRAKMREAALRRYADPAERDRTKAAVKQAFESIDRTGANNGRFGKPMSDETKQKIRDKITERGGVSGQMNPNYRHGRYS
jgi:hypothetical protein